MSVRRLLVYIALIVTGLLAILGLTIFVVGIFREFSNLRNAERIEGGDELLRTTLFQELFEGVPPDARIRLVRQYRMHPEIGSLIASRRSRTMPPSQRP